MAGRSPRPGSRVPPPVQLDDEEIDEALALIEAMTFDSLEGPQFTDHYSDGSAAAVGRQGPGGARRGRRRAGARGAGRAREEGRDSEVGEEGARWRACGWSARCASTLTCRGRGHGRPVPRRGRGCGVRGDRPPSCGYRVGRRCRRRWSACPPGLAWDKRRGRHRGGPTLGATFGPSVRATVQPTLQPSKKPLSFRS